MIRGLGVDLVEIARIRDIAVRNEHIFRQRILGPAERELHPIACRTAVRWAAYARAVAVKEAFFKALGRGLVRGMRWNDVELLKEETGGYRLAISGETLRVFEAAGGGRIAVSAGASKRMASALVILSAGAYGED
jgi:holo-[acyl-carrier protein] synthase